MPRQSVDTIHDVALEMVTEDGIIWVHGIGNDAALAFTEFPVETLLRSLTSTKTRSRAPAPDASAYPARGHVGYLREKRRWMASAVIGLHHLTLLVRATAGSRSMRVSANRWGSLVSSCEWLALFRMKFVRGGIDQSR